MLSAIAAITLIWNHQSQKFSLNELILLGLKLIIFFKYYISEGLLKLQNGYKTVSENWLKQISS